MKNEFPKSFEPKNFEQKWYEKWINNNIFAANNKSQKPAYSILMPPPNVTGILHFGHVLNLTIQDIYIRSKRMQGFEVCWFAGTDHAGIATQSKVEAELRKENISRYDLGREKFTEKVWEWKEKYGGIILQQMRKLGVSADWKRNLFTMDKTASNAVTEVFVKLFDEGLIYKGKRIINWSPLAQTALSDEEVIFKEVQGKLYTLRYYFEDEIENNIEINGKKIGNNENFVENSNKYLLLSTVRPETIFGDTAVAVNPNDERYKSLINKRVKVPLTNRYIPIIADEYADPKFGTGCVKITPAHDPNDFLVGERHDLEAIQTINPDGTLNELTGEFCGMERFAARKAIMEKLTVENFVEKVENYTHNVGFSERGGEPIEPYLSNQWFVKMEPLVAEALQAVNSGEIKFYPSHWTKTYSHWMKNIRDWCISRQLWWGHRIPVYYVKDENYVKNGKSEAENSKFTAARNENEARKKLNLTVDVPLTQDPDSLDTWFSSWLWPLTTMRWFGDGKSEITEDLAKFLPTDLLVTAPEIIFFWVARMIIATKKFKQQIPFKNVYFTSIIRDGQGRKLSKSLGNSPDPLNIIEKYGADAVRFSMIYLAPLGQDVRMEVDVERQDISSMEIGRNFANKVWNAGRFILMKQDEFNDNLNNNSNSNDKFNNNFDNSNEKLNDSNLLDNKELSFADKWIISRYNSTIEKLNNALNDYKLTEYSKIVYDFIWRDFCDWYVEILKVQLNKNSESNSSNSSYSKRLTRFATLIYENIMKILHPIMPFITEEIYHLIENRSENESISTAEFPTVDKNSINLEIETQFELVQNIVEEVRKLRASLNIPSQKLPAIISVNDAEMLTVFENLRFVLMSLCKFSELEIGINLPKPAGATSTVYREIAVHFVVAGTIDIEQERQRLTKEISRLEGNIRGCSGKLSNEQFISRALPEIVEREREKLASMQESLRKVRENLDELG